MNVKEFVESYNKVNNAASKDAVLKKLNVKDYVGIVDKISFADGLSMVHYETNKAGVTTGNVVMNSVVQHIGFVVGIINLYTDLEVNVNDGKEVLESYDLLNKNGLIEIIFKMIGEKELTECNEILTLTMNDFVANNLSTQAFVKSQVDRISDVINVISSPILEFAKSKMSDVDPNDVKMIVEWIKNGGEVNGDMNDDGK